MKTLPLIILAIVLFGISVFFRKLAVDRIHPFQIQAISGVVYALLLPIWIYLTQKNGSTNYDVTGTFFSIICILTSIVAAICFGFALKESNNPGVVSALVSLSPVITMTLSILFLHETMSTTKAIAFLLALASAILVNL